MQFMQDGTAKWLWQIGQIFQKSLGLTVRLYTFQLFAVVISQSLVPGVVSVSYLGRDSGCGCSLHVMLRETFIATDNHLEHHLENVFFFFTLKAMFKNIRKSPHLEHPKALQHIHFYNDLLR